MELYDFVKLVRNKKKTIFSIVFTVLVLVLALNFVLPKKYSSEMQVLIIQNNLNNTDPYLVSKSSEHLGNILTRVIYSGSFYDKVINSGFGIDESCFGKNYKDKLKKWGNTVVARNIQDTGIIYIKASHKDRAQAQLIVEAIGYNLKTSHKEYHGSGDNVEVKIINEAVTSNFPTDPNIIANVLAALIFSVLFSFIYIYLFPDKKYDLSLLPKRKEKKRKKVKSFLVEDIINEIRESESRQFDAKEIYQKEEKEEHVKKTEEESLGGYSEENNDDLDIDYDDIKRKGNINNIL